MYIKSIIIDGFKSYGNRVEIKGFDPQFNAITGLNGSGKSNVLDAICFVLGITNLQQIRASSLTELVYKNGQAGIKKASVTIVFDNRDKEKSLDEYKSCDEITITRQIFSDQSGRNRYLLNGATVQQKRVVDFYNSLQMNVNNPNFLIMQGRVTKVLNMKPPEILSLIEEAAGTSMYELKKSAAERTIESKNQRLKDIDEILRNEIGPRIDRLKQERQQYRELLAVERELQNCTRIHIAYRYSKLERRKEKSQVTLQNVVERIAQINTRATTCETEIKEMDENIVRLEEKRSKECDGKLQKIESELKEAEQAEAIAAATEKTYKNNLATEEKKLKQLKESLAEDTASYHAKKKLMSEEEEVFSKMKEDEQRNLEALEAAKKQFQAVSAGLFSDDGGGDNATLQDQLMQVESVITQAEIERKQCTMQIEHKKKQLAAKSTEMKKTESSFANDKKQLDECHRDIDNFKREMEQLNYEDGLIEQLKNQRRQLQNEIQHLNNEVEKYGPRFRVSYDDPEPNFRRESVHGMLCTLFKVKNPEHNLALETIAGGKLYNVVVDSKDTSTKLIAHGNLPKRFTFIPLKNINSGTIISDQETRRFQNEFGAQNVHSALSLIEYDPIYEHAMRYAFGRSFVCSTYQIANDMAFGKKMNWRCVTTQGDICDPSGTVTGGSAPKSSPILLIVNQYNACVKEYEKKKRQLGDIDKRIGSLEKTADRYNSIKEQLEIKEQELTMLKERLQHTSHYQQKEEVDKLTAEIETLSKKIEECSRVEKENAKKVTTLKNKINNIQSIRDNELKTAEAEMKRLKKKSDDSGQTWKKREQEFAALKLEIEELAKCIENGRMQVEAATETLNQLKEELKNANEEYEKKKIEVAAIQDRRKTERQNIHMQDDEIRKIKAAREKRQKEIGNLKLEKITIDSERKKVQTELKEVEDELAKLLNANEWIEAEKEFFGTSNSNYDFEENKPETIAAKLPALQKKKAELSRSVNSKVANRLGKEEDQYQELLKKKEVVLEDKKNIVAVIKELEEKKNSALQDAWGKIDKDFGSIFSKLLPGADAKLVPLPGKTILNGLEFRVGFGSIWKENLNELSGGQKSLVALSFILAMLLCKPAPLYILDEVDAALDLSHTQNIGQMLKAHFTHSQFIVVSLKEGMFNNANVLFRTKFVDGMSQVVRTTPNSS